ncbi:uncharacterized protein BN660_01714 [Clostridium sp. CAG:448]|nr:uncharacterized protein BN660_01714 [Clostridium sp. CAG:448]
MAEKVGESVLQSLQIFVGKRILGHAAMHLQCAHGGNHDARVRFEPRHTAFDVQELFRSEVGAESRLGDRVVPGLQCHACRQHGIAAVGNIGKGTAMYKCGSPLQCLYQVGFERVAQQRSHGACRVQIAGSYRTVVVGIPDNDP